MDEKVETLLKERHLTLTSIGRRSVAYAIDDLLISFLFLIILWDAITAAQTPEAVAILINDVWLYVVLVKILYHTLFVWQYGASLGKMAMKIKVVWIPTGEKPSLASSFNRAVFRVISEMVFYLGFVWAFFDSARQTWHDKTAATLVVDA